jgi:hypothetical protein
LDRRSVFGKGMRPEDIVPIATHNPILPMSEICDGKS